MNEKVNKALQDVDIAYTELIDIANDITTSHLKDVDDLMLSAYNKIENITNDEIRYLLMKLTLKSYSFAYVKEKSQFKSELAETLRKEAYANNFNTSEGTVAVRDNNAILQTSYEMLAEEIYTLVANTFRAKMDEIHRVVAALTSVLTTRLAEAKLTAVESI